MSDVQVVETPKTKVELISEMKELQQEYGKRATLLKSMTFDEEMKERETRQLERLEAYKAKYKYYASSDGTTKDIDWTEVEKLVRTTLTQDPNKGGYALGFDQTGMEGLGYDYVQGGLFTPMVEEESDAKKYAEREKRRIEFGEKRKETKR